MIKYIKKMRSSHNGIEQFRNDDNIMLNVGKSFTEDELKRTKFSTLLAENMEIIGNVIGDNADIVVREVNIGRSGVRSGVVLYFDNLVDSSLLDGEIIRPLVVEAYTSGLHTGDEIVEQIYAGNLITRAQIKKNDNLKNLLEGLLMGEAGLLIDGIKGFFTINIRGYDYREVSEPEVETVVRGPKDSFIETINTNIGLIRRRIQSPNLTIKTLKIGEVTKTMVCIAYIKGICPSKLAKEVYRRLEKINIDGVLESGYIEEFIQDNPFTPFPQMRNTERPDVAAAALLEGRVVIITDHTPVVLIAPGEFFSLLQSSEDYYNRFYFATATIVLRYLAIVIALLFPASYIAISTYHQEMIPTDLLVSIMSARAGVPLPAFLEAMLMEVSFEILREAGVRLPKPVGQAVSIVGALVIGESAVRASLVSPLTVIIVASTGIASFTIPQYNISLPIRLLRFPLMILAAFLRLFGVMAGLLVILLHLSSLKSFGVPYLSPVSPFKARDNKDTLVRVPWWSFIRRPAQVARNSVRMSSGQKTHSKDKGE